MYVLVYFISDPYIVYDGAGVTDPFLTFKVCDWLNTSTDQFLTNVN